MKVTKSSRVTSSPRSKLTRPQWIGRSNEGILIKQIASTGSQIPVGSPIAAIGKVGEIYEATDSKGPAETTIPSTDSKEEASGEESIPEKESGVTENLVSDAAISNTDLSRIKASPLARKLAEQKGIDLKTITGTGPTVES